MKLIKVTVVQVLGFWTTHPIQFFGDLGITCVDAILSFGVDLIKGRVIFSKDRKYMFGMIRNGSLISCERD